MAATYLDRFTDGTAGSWDKLITEVLTTKAGSEMRTKLYRICETLGKAANAMEEKKKSEIAYVVTREGNKLIVDFTELDRWEGGEY